MELVAEKKNARLSESLEELKNATALTRTEKVMKFVSKLERFARDKEGMEVLYGYAASADEAGFFAGSSWDNPSKLVPSLVRGTLIAGAPTSTMEILSDLRMLAIAKGEYSPEGISNKEALSFLEEILVHNLDLAVGQINENVRARMSKVEIQKVINLFDFLMQNISLDGIKNRLVEEILMICAQRPVETHKIIALIGLIRDRVELNAKREADKVLKMFIDAAFHPSTLTQKFPDLKEYTAIIDKASPKQLKLEAEDMGKAMSETGLVSPCHLPLFLKLMREGKDELVEKALALTPSGLAEWETHRDWLLKLIPEVAVPGNHQFIYGLSRILNRSLLERRAVKAGLNNMRKIKVHNVVSRQIKKSIAKEEKNSEVLPFLLSGIIRILGQPLGVGQGNNPTCQSARGISLWSRHAPAKLIDMVITVATQNKLIMRFENVELDSNKLGKGLVDKLDHELDVVSAVLVPHLDKIYNEMMRRASGRTDDPHKWVNPALYGHWIQVGFASAYDYLSNSILDFEGFTRLFYSSFHPEFNGEKMMTYPCPLGIFITSAHGEMLGFHAISLLRVRKGPEGEMRAYFLNPNNEGRQDWGQGINPTVFGNKEEAGESSLPFHELASRIYAFHYHPTEDLKGVRKVPAKEVNKVRYLAKNSWGKRYIWTDISKIW